MCIVGLAVWVDCLCWCRFSGCLSCSPGAAWVADGVWFVLFCFGGLIVVPPVWLWFVCGCCLFGFVTLYLLLVILCVGLIVVDCGRCVLVIVSLGVCG